MFEAIMQRAKLQAERRARARAQAMAGAAEAPTGINVQAVGDGVRLSGKRLGTRLVFEPALRAFLASLR